MIASFYRNLFVISMSVFIFYYGTKPSYASNNNLVIFAASSLKSVLDDIVLFWVRDKGRQPSVSYAASSSLVRQIEQGAPADILFVADTDWMDFAQSRKLIREGTRVDLLGNRIALIAPSRTQFGIPGTSDLIISASMNLPKILADRRLAIAQVTSVPAGRYAKAALTTLGLWDSVRGHLAETESARAALLLVAKGEAPLGIVYATDATAEPRVRIVDIFSASLHPPIIYPAAITWASRAVDAADFLAFLSSPAAVARFHHEGFTVLFNPAEQ